MRSCRSLWIDRREIISLRFLGRERGSYYLLFSANKRRTKPPARASGWTDHRAMLTITPKSILSNRSRTQNIQIYLSLLRWADRAGEQRLRISRIGSDRGRLMISLHHQRRSWWSTIISCSANHEILHVGSLANECQRRVRMCQGTLIGRKSKLVPITFPRLRTASRLGLPLGRWRTLLSCISSRISDQVSILQSKAEAAQL